MLFGEVYAPQAVLDEWSEGAAGTMEQAADAEGLPTGWLQVRAVDVARTAARANLGRGEEEVIALALELGAEYVVVDDLAARRSAQELGVRVIGTVGVLVAAKRRGAISSVLPLLGSLREEGFRLSDEVLDAVRKDEEGTAS